MNIGQLEKGVLSMRFLELLPILLIVSLAQADIRDSGKWVPSDSFIQINIACVRAYSCEPKKSYMHSKSQKMVRTKTQSVKGVCSTGGGAINACQCITAPPSNRCEIWFEPK